jgi:hypothetical protein
MGLNLSLQALTLPANTEFPGTMQQLQNLIAQYLAIVGESNFSGINYGPTTPDAANRDRPWFKTDGSLHAIGWYTWDGAAWTPVPLFPQSGTFAAAPTGVGVGQLYYATDTGVMCMWTGSAWVTQDGMSGEVRFVRGTNITTILTKYPGWVQVTDMAAHVVGVASDGTSAGFANHTAETFGGEETHTQTVDEMPAHSHTYTTAPNRTGVGGANPIWANDSTGTTSITGGGLPFNVMQPTWFLYAIQKV